MVLYSMVWYATQQCYLCVTCKNIIVGYMLLHHLAIEFNTESIEHIYIIYIYIHFCIFIYLLTLCYNVYIYMYLQSNDNYICICSLYTETMLYYILYTL